MAKTRSCRHLRAGQSAAARAVAGIQFDLPELHYPERLNCVTELLDRWVAAGRATAPA